MVPCFSGNCSIALPHGRVVLMRDLRVGERVMTSTCMANKDVSRCTATVIGLTCTMEGIFEVIKIPQGPTLTPWHPIMLDGDNWIFPEQIESAIRDTVNVVYNIVLDRNDTIIVNGIKCATLAHNFQGEVIGHGYFGDKQRVIRDLSVYSAWTDKEVIMLKPTHLKRNGDGLICSITPW